MSPLSAALAAVALLATGCWTPGRPSPLELERGLVWVFPGVGGGDWTLEGPVRGLRDGGVVQAVRVHDLTELGMLVNLMSYERNRRDAAAIAREVVEYSAAHPGAAIDLLGYSGGGGMAVMVAEALPEELRLRNVVLVQPALSPTYDLQPTLRRLRGNLVHLHATGDWWTLGLGTRVFGTMERAYTASAGKDGFAVEQAVRDPALRDRLVQVAWTAESMEAGHLGMHAGIIGREWNRRFVAPYLQPDATRAVGRGPAAARRPHASGS